MNTRQLPAALARALLPLLAVIAAASPAEAAVTLIQAGADTRTQAGIGAPDTVKQGPSGRSFNVATDPYILSKSDSREDRYFYRVVDSAGSAVQFTGADRADFFVRSSVNADAGVGDFQFPAHGAASGSAFYEFTVDSRSTLSFAYAASASADPSANAYVSLDVFTVDARTHLPRTYLRLGPLSGIDTLSYSVAAGSYGLTLTAFSEGTIPAHIAVTTVANSGAVANLTLSVSAVPEPATAALWALGLAGIGTLRAGRRRALLRRLCGPLLAVPALFQAAPANAAVQFTVTDLGTLGGSSSSATGINAAGQVVGYARIGGDAASHAFLWQDGRMQDLGTLGGTSSQANGINAAGQVVGSARTSDAATHAFLWQDGRMQDLGTLGGTFSVANGINAAGQVVGSAYLSGNTASHAVLWQGGGMQDLGTLGGTSSSASGINAAGQVVGSADIDDQANGHAFLWQSGRLLDLGTLGGRTSGATGINASGQVAGNSGHAFLWQDGSMKDLGNLSGGYSVAAGINAAGQVVGRAGTSDGSVHGFAGTAQGGLTDLNHLLVAGSGVTISAASGINDAGQIAATADLGSRVSHAVLLTPTGSIAWLAGGAGGSFADGAHWEQGFAPSKFLDAVVAPAGRQTLQASADAAVKSLSLGSAAGGSGRPELVLQYGARLTASGGVTVQATGTLGGDGTIVGNLVNRGTVRADNLSVTGSFSNAGLLEGSGTLNASLDNTAGGLLRSGAGQALQVVGAAHRNAGTVEVSDGGALAFSGPFSNTVSGRIFLKGGQLRFAGGADNAGQLNVTFGTSDVHGDVTTLSGGRIALSGHSDTTFYDTVDVASGGELRVSSGSTAVFFGQVRQRTGSVFSGAGSKFYEGGLSVGASPGLGVDAGDVSFGNGNVYLAEIGGLAAGTGYDKYVVNGTLAFGGVLKVVWWQSFAGQAGQHFDLFDWDRSEGTFAQIDLSGAALGAGLRWDTSKLYSSGELSISAVPEPGTWALLLAGLFPIAGAARRRAQAGAAAPRRA